MQAIWKRVECYKSKISSESNGCKKIRKSEYDSVNQRIFTGKHDRLSRSATKDAVSHVNLLVITSGGRWHYTLIKKWVRCCMDKLPGVITRSTGVITAYTDLRWKNDWIAMWKIAVKTDCRIWFYQTRKSMDRIWRSGENVTHSLYYLCRFRIVFNAFARSG